jgi:hypothetical protein
MDDELKPVIAEMANLLSDLATATASLLDEGVARGLPENVAATRQKAQSFRDRARTLCEAVNRLQPNKGL